MRRLLAVFAVVLVVSCAMLSVTAFAAEASSGEEVSEELSGGGGGAYFGDPTLEPDGITAWIDYVFDVILDNFVLLQSISSLAQTEIVRRMLSLSASALVISICMRGL